MSLAARLQIELPQSKPGWLEQTPGAPHVNKAEDRGREQHDQTIGWQERKARSLREEVLSKTSRPRVLNGTTASKSRLGSANPIGNVVATQSISAAPRTSSAARDSASAQADVSKQSIAKLALTQGEAASAMQQPRMPAHDPKDARMSTSVHVARAHHTIGGDEQKRVAAQPMPSTDANIQGDTVSVGTMKVPTIVLAPHTLPLGRSSVVTSDLHKSSVPTAIEPAQRAPVGPRTSVCTRVQNLRYLLTLWPFSPSETPRLTTRARYMWKR